MATRYRREQERGRVWLRAEMRELADDVYKEIVRDGRPELRPDVRARWLEQISASLAAPLEIGVQLDLVAEMAKWALHATGSKAFLVRWLDRESLAEMAIVARLCDIWLAYTHQQPRISEMRTSKAGGTGLNRKSGFVRWIAPYTTGFSARTIRSGVEEWRRQKLPKPPDTIG